MMNDKSAADKSAVGDFFWSTMPGLRAFSSSLSEEESIRDLGVIYIGIERFSIISEALGPNTRDELLLTLTKRILEVLHIDEPLMRVGIDEYAFLVAPGPTAEAFDAVCARISNILRAPYVVDGKKINLDVRLGSCGLWGESTSSQRGNLILQAQIALAKAKESQSSLWVRYSEDLRQVLNEEYRLEDEIRIALENGQFETYYQPKVSCQTGRIVAFEALLRWNHPKLGVVAPGQFVDLLEATGCIVDVGFWVIEQACDQMIGWDKMSLPDTCVAVNLSVRQLEDHSFPEKVGEILKKRGVSPRRLELELTESMLMSDVSNTEEILLALRSLGVQISIDDFGTGYSSLAYLSRLPLNCLKIDRSFVKDITTNPEGASIAKAIIALAHNLHLRVVAEGVETENQLLALVAENCEYIQGFLVSPPVNALAATEFLKKGVVLPAQLLSREAPSRTLLLVDDEPAILSSLKRLLRREGYQIVTASSGMEGLEKLASTQIDVVLSDQRMPNMTGEEFLRRTKKLYPDTVRIVLSGFADMASIAKAINEGAIYKYLSKPWNEDELKNVIRNAFIRKEVSDKEREKFTDIELVSKKLKEKNSTLMAEIDRLNHASEIDNVALKIARDNLSLLPVPVIGVDVNGAVVMCNEAYINENIEPEIVSEIIQRILALQIDLNVEFKHVDINGKTWLISARHLGEKNMRQGALVVISANHEQSFH